MNTLFFIVLCLTVALSWPLGAYMYFIMYLQNTSNSQPNGKSSACSGYISCVGQNWKHYAMSMLIFNACTFVISYAIMSFQAYFPLNPDHKTTISHHLIFNTASSFTSNTNLQHYSGEVTMSYFSQLFALMWLQFTSAGTGIAVLAALARGILGNQNMGNFFIDLQRAIFLILLPLACIVAILMVLGGVPMTLEGAVKVTTIEGEEQIIARGPVAAFVAIKQLGTNGGGFFGANSAHPFENPNFFTNILSSVLILLLPMASVWMFGHITKRIRHAQIIFGVMLVFLVIKIAISAYFESFPAKAFEDLPIKQTANLEGKEIRLGSDTSVLWSVLTTSSSNGSVNAMHDSLNPITGLVAMLGMWLNSTFGGVGVGMLNMFIYLIISVFIAGMMVGRTPEYLNKRIDAYEIKLAVLAFILHPLLILLGTAVFAVTSWGRDTLSNVGPHGFSEILYEFSSATANNGSGFEGLGDNTLPWNIVTGIIMLLARFIPIVIPLAIAGSLSMKRISVESTGTLSVEDITFGLMLFVTIIFTVALTFLPAAMLGPIAEHVILNR